MALLATLAVSSTATAQVQVTTYHNDNLRTGLNSNETVLNLTNVRAKNFGLLFSLPVDGQVYAQPLYLSNVTIPNKGVHNVVYVATEHNSLYAFDADDHTGANALPLWKRNFGPSVPGNETGSDDITVEIGITSTPVIRVPQSGDPIIYVVSKYRTTDAQNNRYYYQRLHAVSAVTGAEQAGSPIPIRGRVLGTGEASVNGVLDFKTLLQHSRSALLLVPPAPNSTDHNKLYVAYASHGDNGPYHGWVFVFDIDKMSLLKIVNTTPNAHTDPSGYPLAAGGIWQGGSGPASDGSSVYFATGNGWFDAASGAFGDAIVRMDNSTFGFVDHFAPHDQLDLDDTDADLGSGGVMLIPPSGLGNSGKQVLIQSGKRGTIYVVDTANMGHFDGATDHIYQELPGAIGGIFGCPAYFNNTVFFGPSYSGIVSFPFANGKFTRTTPLQYTSTQYAFPGPTPSISSNGLTNGIVWAIQADGYSSGGTAILHAYNSHNLSAELYNSSMVTGRDVVGGAVKFAVPTIANGKVYVGSAGQVGVFGLGSWAAPPTVTPVTGNYVHQATITVTDATPGAKVYYTLDGSVPTTSSKLYTVPIVVKTSTVFKAKAFLSNGLGGSAVIEKDYLIDAVIGTGTGLKGAYFQGLQDPSGTPTATEIDPTINFSWNGASPIAGVDGTNFAAEWTGQIQAKTTGAYTLSTISDDGVRVYIDGNLVIDNYTYHGATTDTATVNFVAGDKHTIDIKFFQGSGGAVMQLYWSAPGLPTEIVPKTQLYPAP